MKPEIPAGNAIIATLYLFIIIAIGYTMKLIFRPTQPTGRKDQKYTNANLGKGLTSAVVQGHLPLNRVLVQSFIYKYSGVGTFFNNNKCYLLKQVFIFSVIFVACTSINKITLWPLALSFVFVCLNFVAMEVFKLPFVWNINIKVEEEKKANQRSSTSQHIEIEPGLIVNEHRQQEAKTDNKSAQEYSYKYLGCVGAFGFASLVMVTQTMMTVYNSISNLGALNIGSVASVIAIDQLAIRPALGIILIAVSNIIMLRLKAAQDNPEGLEARNEIVSRNQLGLFEMGVFRNLCEDVLLRKMNQIYDEHGEPSNYEMGASPTRKKTFSPSKIPKANPLVAESDTLENLDITKRREEQSQEQKVEEEMGKSPIRQIDMAMMKESVWLTTVQKEMFCEETENNKLEINKSVDIQSAQKIKVNPNQYFSVQRLPKDDLQQEPMEDDGLVLVEAGLNLVKEREGKMKPNTIDIEFSPTKKRKKTVGAYPKRRQLIITGSSPYLEYLPDMMKKEKQNKKNMTPSSHNHIPTVSRKVL